MFSRLVIKKIIEFYLLKMTFIGSLATICSATLFGALNFFCTSGVSAFLPSLK